LRLMRRLWALTVLLGLAQAQGFGLGFKSMWPPELTGFIATWETTAGLEARATLGGGVHLDGYWRLPGPTYAGAYVGAGAGIRLEGTLVLVGLLGYEWALGERWAYFLEGGPGYRVWLQPPVPTFPRPEAGFVYLSAGLRFKL